MEKEKYYIIMADIIGSGKHNAYELMRDFNDVINSINTENKERLLSPLTITLGDEFQGISSSIQDAIVLMIKIEEKIIHLQKNLKLRYVLYHGEIDTEINQNIAHGMLGKGLTNARYLLESLKKERKDRFIINIDSNPYLTEVLDLAFVGFQSIVDDWRPKDFEVVSPFLQLNNIKGDYKVVADKIGKDSSSVFRRKNSLQIHQYFSSRKLLINLTKSIDNNIVPISEEEMLEISCG